MSADVRGERERERGASTMHAAAGFSLLHLHDAPAAARLLLLQQLISSLSASFHALTSLYRVRDDVDERA